MAKTPLEFRLTDAAHTLRESGNVQDALVADLLDEARAALEPVDQQILNWAAMLGHGLTLYNQFMVASAVQRFRDVHEAMSTRIAVLAPGSIKKDDPNAEA